MSAQQLAQNAAAVQAAPSTGVKGLKGFITHHPILAFLILAYGIAWILYLSPLLSNAGLGIIPVDLPPVQLFLCLSSILGIAGSAYLVTGVTRGRAGMRELRSHMLRWRVGIYWYLLALFGLPLACILAALPDRVVTTGDTDSCAGKSVGRSLAAVGGCVYS